MDLKQQLAAMMQLRDLLVRSKSALDCQHLEDRASENERRLIRASPFAATLLHEIQRPSRFDRLHPS